MFRAGSRRWWSSALAAAALTAPMVLMMAVAATSAAAAPRAPATSAAAAPRASTSRPQGPCDLYALGGTPCSAAHSTTRALYASYDGPLYQVRRLSDGHRKDIGVVEPSTRPFPDAGGYANAAAQDAFCADTTCLITTIYDQSPNHNDLTQAPRGNFSGPALGGANNLPIASAAPITVSGHKAYGVYIEPGMGLRDNDTTGIAVDDQAEGMYWLVDGHHFNDGCCFDYGNTEIDSKDDGNGTMETSYFGDATAWYHGQPPGPWVMTDQENNLVGCVNPGSSSKLCPNLPSVTDRFVTAVAKGEPHHWATLDGNAQQGALSTLYDGPRVDASYDPMRKQGGIVLGNGGDNSNGSQGTFYEGVLTTGYPSDATDQAVQANIVATRYDVHRLSLTPAPATDTPPGRQTFTPGSRHRVTQTFTNTSSSRAVGVTLSLTLPSRQWTSVVAGTDNRAKTFHTVAPGASVSATFTVTSGPVAFDGDLIGQAVWTDPSKGAHKGARQSETTTENVRNVSPIKINEFRIGTTGNATDSFIELSNAGNRTVDLSNWTLDEHAIGQANSSTITIPGGTRLEAGGHYLLGLGTSGLAIPAHAGDSRLYLRSATGLKPGDRVQVGSGRTAEVRTISAVDNIGATGPRVPGKIGNAVKLSGNGDYVALPGAIVSSLDDFSISAWVNPAADTTWSRIFDFGNNTNQYMFLSVDGGGAGLRFAITTGGNGAEQQLTGGGLLPLNTWSHVAVTLSGNTGRLYLNGNLVATNADMTLHPASLGSTTNNWIGRSQFPDPSLNATVDDFQIYDHALTATDVGSLAGGQAGAGNVASYTFDEASGETALDSSGQGHNATIVSDASAASSGTPLSQPEPDGPITVAAGSTNVPVTSTSGFGVGEKVAIGYGRTLDVATVTAVGQAGTQAALLAAAPAGTTILKVSSTAAITAGDSIRLDIGSRMETVTVAGVGTAGSTGTGLVLTAPLTFSHSANLPFTDRGTGVTFTPATRFAHVSNEPVRPLGSSVTLNRRLSRSHAIDAAVVDAAVTNAGYQATPDQWFGGPNLTSGGGSMVLANARGVVADSLNFGRLVDPWLAEGYQGTSGPGQGGCTVPVPPQDRSAARYPDGTDTDSNCSDFMVTATPTPGATNRGVALDAGPLVSLHGTTPGDTSYIRHDDTDDLVVLSNVTAGSSATVKQDATFVEAAGLANPSCVSFESINRPGSYLRHFAFVLHLQPNDASAGFAQDATFCPTSGNSGSGVSFQSANFPTKYIRAYQGGVYVAGNGGDNAWDDPTGWAASSSWLQGAAWAQPPQARAR